MLIAAWAAYKTRGATMPSARSSMAHSIVRLLHADHGPSLPGRGVTVPAWPSGAVHLVVGGWPAGHGLRMEASSLNFSIPAPLNRRPKSLQMLARDLEADTRQGAGRTGSIGRKANSVRSLVALLVII